MKRFLKILIFIFLLSFANQVFAINVGQLINDIINFIIDIAIAAAGIIIIVGGYLMITSAGDPQKFEKGKKALLYGAVGLILILIAQALAEELIKLVSG